ncbi:PH domain-containing protein [Streptomyces paludis]|uniref:PH domain-containing protein n=1 Tax=Streptomyces paludis TaxID=2282738 RepID=UPI001E2ED279|nr:PH domain-containing protein [Streptomyces paludis]
MLRKKSLWIFTIVSCCAIYAGIPVIWLVARPNESTGELLMVASVLLAVSLVMIRIGRVRVEIHDGGLRLVGVLGRDWIPWGAYLLVETDGELVVRARGERSYAVSAFSGSLIEEMLKARGRSRNVRAGEAIRAAARSAPAEARRDRDVVSKSWELIPADLLLAQVPVCLALTQSGIVPM